MATASSAPDGSGIVIRPPHCFVTVGATASFRALIEEVASAPFFEILKRHSFASLTVQCGPDLAFFQEKIAALGAEDRYGITVVAFDLTITSDMQVQMLACRSERGVRAPGCIIAHAGTGTVLDAMKYSAPLVVVPNPNLMDNHQAELAEECEKKGWAVYGKLGHVAEALNRAQDLVAKGWHADLPAYMPPPFPVPEEQRTKLFDWLV